jgi:hypothetical protein
VLPPVDTHKRMYTCDKRTLTHSNTLHAHTHTHTHLSVVHEFVLLHLVLVLPTDRFSMQQWVLWVDIELICQTVVVHDAAGILDAVGCVVARFTVLPESAKGVVDVSSACDVAVWTSGGQWMSKAIRYDLSTHTHTHIIASLYTHIHIHTLIYICKHTYTWTYVNLQSALGSVSKYRQRSSATS